MRCAIRTLLRPAWLAALAALLVCLLAPAHALLAQDGPIADLDDAELAVVLIEAVGSFVDPYEGEQSGAFGYGSGFIIDPSGIAVTNNHVVTGGALYRVFVPGRDALVNARVLGVSECSDLAVIDLAGGDYPYLEFSSDLLRRHDEVYAAGYPGDSMEYVLSDGEVLMRNAPGESDWASLDKVIAHNAPIEPGSSGGPLLNENAQVVGVNYALGDDADEGYAIGSASVREILEQLTAGVDVEALGINGMALDERRRTGIWVASVATGSIADAAGLLPGDLILEIEHVAMATDGTMADYCDVLRSHAPGEPLQLKVYRQAQDVTLVGQFNGVALEVTTAGLDAPAGGAAELEPASAEYVEVTDSNGVVSFDVPLGWDNIIERDWERDGRIVGTQLFASPDPEHFLSDWSVPGISFSWSFSLDQDVEPRELAASPEYSERCDDVETTSSSEPDDYTAHLHYYTGCDEGMVASVSSLEDLISGYILKVELYGAADTDWHAADRFFATLQVDAEAAESLAARNFRIVFDESGRIALSVPDTWRDVVSEPIEDEGLVGRRLTVATNVEKFEQYWGFAGISILLYDDVPLSPDLIDGWLDDEPQDDMCTYVDRYDFAGVGLAGRYDVWAECGGEEHSYTVNGLLLTDGDLVSFIALLPSETYLAGLETMLSSLTVNGEASVTLQPAPEAGAGNAATVVAGTLNIRSGPGTFYGVLGLAHKGASAVVLGQYNGCAWLVVLLTDGSEGWISGDAKYTSLAGACSDLPARSAP